MRARLQPVQKKLASLLWYLWGPLLNFVWSASNRWPRALGWAWPMVRQPEWQKNTVQSTLLWAATTPVIFYIAHRTGHGFWVSISVSLIVDTIGFTANKLWIWRKRQVGIPKSGARNFVLWSATFGFNCFMAWLVIGRVGLENARFLMVVYGAGINPVMFKARDRLVFGEANIKELTAAWVRKERAKAESLHPFLRS